MDVNKLQMLLRKSETARSLMIKAHCNATKITTSFSSDPKAQGVHSDKVGDGATEYLIAKEQYERIMNEIAVMRNELKPLIRQMENEIDQAIAIKRYLDGKTVKAIAIELSYSEQNIYRILTRINSELESENMATKFESENEIGTLMTDDYQLVRRVKRLKERFPDKVNYTLDNGIRITATIPADWLFIKPPRNAELTEEQRKELEERLGIR